MAYRDVQIRQATARIARAEARREQDDLPETERERTARINPLTTDISEQTIIGLSVIAGMTT